MIQEKIEELAEQYEYTNGTYGFKAGFKAGAKSQAEEMFDIMQQYASFCVKCDREKLPLLFAKEWYEQFNK
jgi:hypothetical protein